MNIIEGFTISQGPHSTNLSGKTDQRLRKMEVSGELEGTAIMPQSPFLKGSSALGCRDLVRLFVVGHTVTGLDENPEIAFDIVGSTGNIYKTTIGRNPTCNCPDGQRGNQCKHICYVLVFALRAPGELQYQLAFLNTELREIWQSSPLNRLQATSIESTDGNRKPIEGDCPICFMEFEPHEDTVWCKAACGNNIHKTCFAQWAATTRKSGVRCVYCRAAWKNDTADLNINTILKSGSIGEDGYVNVAAQFGLSTERVPGDRIITGHIITVATTVMGPE
ncbi:RING finger domain protein [Penicillium verhagenii]|nr:RING finger domain protein [Penicillium verhagenii]